MERTKKEMKLLTNKQDPRNRIIVVDAYINGDRIVCDANSDDFDLWEDCWTIEDLEDEPINPFDTKLFQDGVKREDERIMKIITDSIFYGAGVEYKDVLDYLDYLEKLKEQEHPCDSAQFEEGFKTGLELGLRKKKEQKPDDNQFPPLEGLDAIKAQYYDRGFKNGFDEGVDSVKPAEWSEEDEKNRRNLMSLLANMRGDRITEETYQKYYPWLKDLRSRPKPSDNWKPSEEQPQVADASKMEQEVDLEKEIDKGIADYSFTKTIDLGEFKTTVLDYAKIARHFYELGLNARKEG